MMQVSQNVFVAVRRAKAKETCMEPWEIATRGLCGATLTLVLDPFENTMGTVNLIIVDCRSIANKAEANALVQWVKLYRRLYGLPE